MIKALHIHENNFTLLDNSMESHQKKKKIQVKEIQFLQTVKEILKEAEKKK